MQSKLCLKFLFFLLCMFITVWNGFAFCQGRALQKKTATVADFTYDAQNAGKAKEMSLLAGKIMNHLNGTKNLKMLERKDFKTIKMELERQKGEDHLNGLIVKQGRAIGAQIILSGQIHSISEKEGIVFTLKAYDVETTEIIATETIRDLTVLFLNGPQIIVGEGSGNSRTGGSSAVIIDPIDIILKSINNVNKKIDDFLNKNFPLEFAIYEATDFDKKNFVKEMLILGEDKNSLSKSDRVQIVESRSIKGDDGRTIRHTQRLGTARVISIEGDLIRCRINSGNIEESQIKGNKSVYCTKL